LYITHAQSQQTGINKKENNKIGGIQSLAK
jgi:hypothetical protein